MAFPAFTHKATDDTDADNPAVTSSVTVAAGEALVVVVYSLVSNYIPTGVVWGGGGGEALTKQAEVTDTGSFQGMSIWTLAAPTAATSTVTVTRAGSPTAGRTCVFTVTGHNAAFLVNAAFTENNQLAGAATHESTPRALSSATLVAMIRQATVAVTATDTEHVNSTLSAWRTVIVDEDNPQLDCVEVASTFTPAAGAADTISASICIGADPGTPSAYAIQVVEGVRKYHALWAADDDSPDITADPTNNDFSILTWFWPSALVSAEEHGIWYAMMADGVTEAFGLWLNTQSSALGFEGINSTVVNSAIVDVAPIRFGQWWLAVMNWNHTTAQISGIYQNETTPQTAIANTTDDDVMNAAGGWSDGFFEDPVSSEEESMPGYHGPRFIREGLTTAAEFAQVWEAGRAGNLMGAYDLLSDVVQVFNHRTDLSPTPGTAVTTANYAVATNELGTLAGQLARVPSLTVVGSAVYAAPPAFRRGQRNRGRIRRTPGGILG